ncbi:MMPL family transporter [Micromonospora sp. NPDC048930]|uniref:MMPL family transporter n=1 Tax=Micromonospora sp. NPDC048930 TaxID=3364261 RepID=UPI0037141D0F
MLWSVRHRALALVGWLGLMAAALLASSLVTGPGARPSDPGEAGRARRVLDAQRAYEPPVENVLVQARDGGLPFRSDRRLRQATEDLVAALAQGGAVTEIRSPLTDADRISADGRSGLVSWTLAGPAESWDDHDDAAVRAVDTVAARHPEVRLARAGDRSLARAVDQGVKDDFQVSHNLSLPLTVLILVLVFGSLVAAALPLVLTLTATVTTFALLQVIDHWLPINSATSAIVLLIGTAVGVDYCLFHLRRVREERAAGTNLAEALRRTAGTSGPVVVVSGLIVMLCVSGLLLTGIGTLRGVALGTFLVVGLAVLGSVTALPALLALLGDRVDRLRVPFLGRRRTTPTDSRFWIATARRVVRRPLLWGGLATAALLVAALPALRMHPQDASVVDSLPRSVPAVDAALRMQAAFPGSPTPARVVAWQRGGGPVDAGAVDAAVEQLRSQVRHSGGLLAEPISTVRVDDVVVIRVPLAGSGTDRTSERALALLRDRALPETLGGLDSVDYAVMGRTAFAHDFVRQLVDRAPLVLGVVLVLAALLLAAAFRSPAVAVVSIGLNLLSIGAAYGVLTWVFQDGHLESVLGFTSYGGVVSWLPLFMFVLLFGLSMDYHVFILSRVRERWAAGAEPRQAVVAGVGGSSGVVTSAAVIMTAVFGVFLALSAIEYKMLGLGMAAAIVIDATVVRGVLLPAALAVLGDRAWGRRARPAVPEGAGADRTLVSAG